MGTIKMGKLIHTVTCAGYYCICGNCYGANEKAEEFFEQGKKLSSVENADSAIDNYSKAIEIDPKFVKAYNNRGIVYVWKKQYDLVVADFNKAIELDPKNGKAYNCRAIVYSYRGETDKARQDIQKAQSLGIVVDPDFLKQIEAPPLPLNQYFINRLQPPPKLRRKETIAAISSGPHPGPTAPPKVPS